MMAGNFHASTIYPVVTDGFSSDKLTWITQDKMCQLSYIQGMSNKEPFRSNNDLYNYRVHPLYLSTVYLQQP